MVLLLQLLLSLSFSSQSANMMVYRNAYRISAECVNGWETPDRPQARASWSPASSHLPPPLLSECGPFPSPSTTVTAESEPESGGEVIASRCYAVLYRILLHRLPKSGPHCSPLCTLQGPISLISICPRSAPLSLTLLFCRAFLGPQQSSPARDRPRLPAVLSCETHKGSVPISTRATCRPSVHSHRGSANLLFRLFCTTRHKTLPNLLFSRRVASIAMHRTLLSPLSCSARAITTRIPICAARG